MEIYLAYEFNFVLFHFSFSFLDFYGNLSGNSVSFCFVSVSFSKIFVEIVLVLEFSFISFCCNFPFLCFCGN